MSGAGSDSRWLRVQPHATVTAELTPISLGWSAKGEMVGVTSGGGLMMRKSLTSDWEDVTANDTVRLRHVSLPYGTEGAGKGLKNESRLLGVDTEGRLFQKVTPELTSRWALISSAGIQPRHRPCSASALTCCAGFAGMKISLSDVSMGIGGYLYGIGKGGCLYRTSKPHQINSTWVQVTPRPVYSHHSLPQYQELLCV